MKLLSKASCLLVFAALCASASTIEITYLPPILNVLAGATDVEVYAILQNVDPNDTVFLNSDVLDVPQSSAVNDLFFTNVPISLGPSATTGPVELFDFDVASDAVPGSYTGTWELLGGVGVTNQNDFDLLGSQSFTVEVSQAPEPVTELLLGAGLLAIACVSRRLKLSRRG
ncbi:MAG: hypothetical protein ACLP59_21530 [Bryobacteraceae bacterium]